MNRVEDLQGKNVAVIGLGITGKSCVSFLNQCKAQVVAFDTRSDFDDALPNALQPVLGPMSENTLLSMDLIVISPGISTAEPAVQTAIDADIPVIGDIELFSWVNTKPVIAITGSNGKSTVTSLVHHMLQSAGINSKMAGNIGIPALSLIGEDYDIAVLELSSFQLETTYSLNPTVATVLNVSADHLDRYRDFAHYTATKQRIYDNAEYCVYNTDDIKTLPSDATLRNTRTFGQQGDFRIAENGRSLVCDDGIWLDYQSCELVGRHNAVNILAAAALCQCAGVPLNKVVAGTQYFKALPHRCQCVSHFNQITWIDDSKATNVGATETAVRSFSWKRKGKLVLIAGGDAKGADLRELEATLKNHVDHVITLGKDGGQLLSIHPSSYKVDSLKQAVVMASQLTSAGDVVLLSPACASLDMFDNYQHRGQVFTQAIKDLS